MGERADERNGYRKRQKKKKKKREMSQTETERVCVQSAFSRSGVFDVGRVVPTCPAPLCQEITAPSPRSPADCWEKRSLFDVLKRDLQCNLAFHLFPFLLSVIHPDSGKVTGIFTSQKLYYTVLGNKQFVSM